MRDPPPEASAFAGAGTTLAVAECLGRKAIGCELYQKNADLYAQRLAVVRPEVAEYLRERSRGEKASAIEAAASGQTMLFGGSP
jgi:DNA modification methylase